MLNQVLGNGTQRRDAGEGDRNAPVRSVSELVDGARRLAAIVREESISRLVVTAGEVSWHIEAPPTVPATTVHSGQAPPGPPADPPADPQRYEVRAPLVGACYRAPSPGERPFVAVGDRVRAGQPLAIVEAMKLMNEVCSDRDGVVREILCQDREVVEYGELMFVLATG